MNLAKKYYFPRALISVHVCVSVGRVDKIDYSLFQVDSPEKKIEKKQTSADKKVVKRDESASDELDDSVKEVPKSAKKTDIKKPPTKGKLPPPQQAVEKDDDYQPGDAEEEEDEQSTEEDQDHWVNPLNEQKLCDLWSHYEHLYVHTHAHHKDAAKRKDTIRKISIQLNIPCK